MVYSSRSGGVSKHSTTCVETCRFLSRRGWWRGWRVGGGWGVQGERRKTTRRGLKCATPSELFLSSQYFLRRVHCVCTTCYLNFYTYIILGVWHTFYHTIIYLKRHAVVFRSKEWTRYCFQRHFFVFIQYAVCDYIIVCVFVYGNIVTTIVRYIDAGTVFGDLYEHDSAHGKQRKPRGDLDDHHDD